MILDFKAMLLLYIPSVAIAAFWHFTGEFGLVTHLAEISKRYYKKAFLHKCEHYGYGEKDTP